MTGGQAARVALDRIAREDAAGLLATREAPSQLRVRLRSARGGLKPFVGRVDRVPGPSSEKSCGACGKTLPAGVPRWRTSNLMPVCDECVAEGREP